MADSTSTRILTTLNHSSAPFISSFLLIHLAAPIFANVGGSEMSSQVMILGREYYQTSFGENALLLGPLTVHALSGIAKRVLAPRKPLSLVHLSAYPLLVLLPIHFLTHRAIPSLSEDAIGSLSPGELDYQFVVHHLQKYPILSWTLYGTLVVGTIIHASEGAVVLWNSWNAGTGGRRVNQRGKIARLRLATALLAFAGPVFSGMYILSREVPFALKAMTERFDAVFQSFPLYSLGS